MAVKAKAVKLKPIKPEPLTLEIKVKQGKKVLITRTTDSKKHPNLLTAIEQLLKEIQEKLNPSQSE